MKRDPLEAVQIPRRRPPVRRNPWLRGAFILSVLWAIALSGIALYESLIVDPWTFIGETRGKIFFLWSEHVLYTESTFGDVGLVFNDSLFWTVLLLPIVSLIACSAVMPALTRRVRRRPQTR
jgi:hypothetical protein